VHLRATSVPCLESAFHSRPPSTTYTVIIILALKVLDIFTFTCQRGSGHKKLHPPAHAAAPHRTAAISRTRKTHTKTVKYPPPPPTRKIGIHSHIFLYDPRILVDSLRTGTLFSLLDSLFLSCQGPFSPTLAPIPFTATRTTGPSFSPSGISPLTPRQCHHTTSQAARPLEKQETAQRASLSAPRVCTVGHLGS
jgi:hypothetical protein